MNIYSIPLLTNDGQLDTTRKDFIKFVAKMSPSVSNQFAAIGPERDEK